MIAAPRVPVYADPQGLPFLDDVFAATRLLALTAAVRHCTAGPRGIETGITDDGIEAWLAPSRAYLLGTGYGQIPALPLPPRASQQVKDTLAALAQIHAVVVPRCKPQLASHVAFTASLNALAELRNRERAPDLVVHRMRAGKDAGHLLSAAAHVAGRSRNSPRSAASGCQAAWVTDPMAVRDQPRSSTGAA